MSNFFTPNLKDPSLSKDQYSGSATESPLAGGPVSSKTGLPLNRPYDFPQERRYQYRNPNSPEAIQARLDNLPNPDPYSYRRILKLTDFYIRINADEDSIKEVTQRYCGTSVGGPFGSQTYLGTKIKKDRYTGEVELYSYYHETLHLRWRIFGQELEGSLADSPGTFYSGHPQVMWRNYKRAIFELEPEFKLTELDRTVNLRTRHIDEDQYFDTGFGPIC